MKDIIKLARPHQYVKNFFIFLPLFFALEINNWDLVWRTAVVAAGFSLCASAIYILNDWFDIEADRMHPTKKDRPLASGAVSPQTGLIMMVILLGIGATAIGLISTEALWLTGIYVGNNLLYSFRLKHIAIVDINMIAVGFVLRLFIGSAAAGGMAPLSMWIILITFLLALFLGLAKRRDDVLLSEQGKQVRKSIKGYNLEFINGAMMVMASVVLVAYISYTISEEVQLRLGTDKLYLTVIFVIVGIMRYMQITFVERRSGSPTKMLLKDLFLQVTIGLWLLSFVLLIPAFRELIFGPGA